MQLIEVGGWGADDLAIQQMRKCAEFSRSII